MIGFRNTHHTIRGLFLHCNFAIASFVYCLMNKPTRSLQKGASKDPYHPTNTESKFVPIRQVLAVGFFFDWILLNAKGIGEHPFS